MKIISLLFIMIFITACWSDKSEKTIQKTITNTGSQIPSDLNGTWTTKIQTPPTRWPKQTWKDFSVDIKTLQELWDIYSIEKIWQILPNQSLKINAQVSGNIWSMSIKEWDPVLEWQILISMTDNFSKYSLELEKSQIDYDRQVISKDSQVLSIDKNIDDTKRNLNDAKRIFDNALVTAEEKRKIAKINFENSDTTNTNSKAYLEFEKSQLDYENLLNTNRQTLEWYIRDVQREYNNLFVNLSNIINFWEDLYWLGNNDDLSDKINDYFWTKDTIQKSQTKKYLLELRQYNIYLATIEPDNVSQENILELMSTYRDWYDIINKFLNSLDITLNNSISSLWSLSESDIDNYISRVNSFQSSNQWDLSSYNSLLKWVNNFLETYKETELIALKNLQIDKKIFEDGDSNSDSDYTKELINIENELASIKKSYDSLKANYDNSLQSKEVSIRSLDNSIKSARNNLRKSQIEYNKLAITAPIRWIIQSIKVDIWENITAWTQVINLISNDITKINISFSNQEIENISTWDIVKIEYGKKTYEWKVFSISRVADQALNYNVQVNLNENIWLIWWSAKVYFQQNITNINIPLNIIDVTWDDIWTINTLVEGVLQKVEVTLWKISGNNIAILSPLDNNIQIIITDMTNFNPNTQKLNSNNK